jgi:hypothetical protein
MVRVGWRSFSGEFPNVMPREGVAGRAAAAQKKKQKKLSVATRKAYKRAAAAAEKKVVAAEAAEERAKEGGLGAEAMVQVEGGGQRRGGRQVLRFP